MPNFDGGCVPERQFKEPRERTAGRDTVPEVCHCVGFSAQLRHGSSAQRVVPSHILVLSTEMVFPSLRLVGFCTDYASACPLSYFNGCQDTTGLSRQVP